MTDRIEYLDDLGVTCLWLMPFYPTARKDDGYDITDFFGVDPRLGTLGDFVELVRTARVERHPRHRRLRHEPHLRRAPVVQVRPPQQGRPVPRLLRVELRPSRSRAPKDVVFPDRRTASGSSTPRPTSGTCTTSTSTSPTSTSRIPKCRRRSPGLSASGSSSGSPASGSTPCRSSSPRTACREIPAFRPLPIPRRRPQLRHPPGRGRGAARRGQSGLQGPEDVLRRPRRRRAQHAVRLHRDAEHLPVARPRRRPSDRQGAAATTDARHHEPVGELRAQPRRAHPRQAE